jgi:hypothetical protein
MFFLKQGFIFLSQAVFFVLMIFCSLNKIKNYSVN